MKKRREVDVGSFASTLLFVRTLRLIPGLTRKLRFATHNCEYGRRLPKTSVFSERKESNERHRRSVKDRQGPTVVLFLDTSVEGKRGLSFFGSISLFMNVYMKTFEL